METIINTDIITIENGNYNIFDHIFGDLEIDECEKYDYEEDKDACFSYNGLIYNEFKKQLTLSNEQPNYKDPNLFKFIYERLCKPCKKIFIKECEKWFINNIDVSYEKYKKNMSNAYSVYNDYTYKHYIVSKLIDNFYLKLKFNMVLCKSKTKICDYNYTYSLYFDNTINRNYTDRNSKNKRILLKCVTIVDDHKIEGSNILFYNKIDNNKIDNNKKIKYSMAHDNKLDNLNINTSNSDSTIAIANFTLYDINILWNAVKPFIDNINTIFSLSPKSKMIAVIGDKYIGLARHPKEYYHFIKKTMTHARASHSSPFNYNIFPLDLIKHIFCIMFDNILY